ncbi:MAG: AAA family ATPase [Lachnospiraceae bacterium]|nr:AAA family ATPase [Lachnospiraceae bacterium]
MSEFLKFAYEIIAKIVYNLSELGAAFIKLFITGWVDYYHIFLTYFKPFGIFDKVLAVLLMLVLVAIPLLAVVLIIRHIVLRQRLKRDGEDNGMLLREIGRLNRQVLDLMEEKNKILALKVNAMGGTKKIPYMGASALTDDELPTLENVTGNGVGGVIVAGQAGEGAEGGAVLAGGVSGNVSISAEANIEGDTIASAATAAVVAAEQAKIQAEKDAVQKISRFPKLTLVDKKYENYVMPEYDNEVTLPEFVERFRLFAAGTMKLYYTPEIIRRFVSGMAASKVLILEGISGTGKTSLPYSFSRFLNNPATIVSVQPSYRDRTELLGYFNEFSKRFNETEFLRALYEAGYRMDPSFIVLDEMNLARIEYYFAEMLSILEMPSVDEWLLDLVPTAWQEDPQLLDEGKIHVSPRMWFVGTANNDDSTFTITDKVYDRAIPIELNERADAFECDEQPRCEVTAEHLQLLFQKAKVEHPISGEVLEKMEKLNSYLMTRFKLAFGNRIMKQMYDFIPVYVACGGSEVGGMDYIIARKVLKKFESMNVSFVRDEIKGLIQYIEKVFGKGEMPDSIEYLTRIQNLY